jgi:Ca-activated chloride channel family protein
VITLLEPERLWLLLAVAAVAVAYVRGRRRRAAYPVTLSTARFAALAQRRAGPAWRRHLPAAAFLGLLGLLVVGFARPAVATRVPTEAVDVVVALDTSASMTAADVDPSRVEAARAAAAAFVEQLPDEARVGVVAFSGGASLALAPSTDREQVLRAIRDATGPGQGTAIGEAVAVGVSALSRLDGGAAGGASPAGEPDGTSGSAANGGTDGAADGDRGRRVVVLSDGDSTVGRPVEDAAREATAAGVGVDAIAFGTSSGTVEVDGRTVPVPVEDASLTQLAEATGGRLHAAGDTAALAGAYADIAGDLGSRVEQREVTGAVGLVAAIGAALVGLLGLRRAAVLPAQSRPRLPARSGQPRA